jgi:hypothetical protein
MLFIQWFIAVFELIDVRNTIISSKEIHNKTSVERTWYEIFLNILRINYFSDLGVLLVHNSEGVG